MNTSKNFSPFVIGIILLILVVGSFFAIRKLQTTPPPVEVVPPPTVVEPNSYVNEQYGFEVSYASTLIKDPSPTLLPDALFDGIDTSRALILALPKKDFKGTNISSAGLAVGVIKDNHDQNSCIKDIQGTPASNVSVTMGGNTFYKAETSEGAAGSTYFTYRLNTFHGGYCYAGSLTIRMYNDVASYNDLCNPKSPNYNAAGFNGCLNGYPVVGLSGVGLNPFRNILDGIMAEFRFTK